MGDHACSDVPRRVGPDEIFWAIDGPVRARRRKELLVYIHVPFCSSKCHFCDLVSNYSTADLIATGDIQANYVRALCNQIRSYGPRLSALGYRVTNVYWGGGTPTRLQVRHLSDIHDALASSFNLSSVNEYTLECSPETLTAEKLSLLMQAGLNRISIGVQSFDSQVLRRMGRAHTADAARAAIELVRSAGPDNFNIELITNFSEQMSETTLNSISEAIALRVPHITTYLFRPNCDDLVSVKQLLRGSRCIASADDAYHCQNAVSAALTEAGYAEYIHSYFARDPRFHFDCEDFYFPHRGDYIGFGAGAFSFLGRHAMKQPSSGQTVDVGQYIRDPLSMGVLCSAVELLPQFGAEVALESLGTSRGLSYELWADQFGVEESTIKGDVQNRPLPHQLAR